MTTKKIENIKELKHGDKIVMTMNSYVNTELSLYTEKELEWLANNVSFGEIIKVGGISSEDTIMGIFSEGSIFEIKPYIFEKIIEDKSDPIHKLGFSIWKTYNKDKSIENYYKFIDDLREHGLSLLPSK